VNVGYAQLQFPIVPKQHIATLRPLLPSKYSPLQHDGNGLQSVYLAEISAPFAASIESLLNDAGNKVQASVETASSEVLATTPDAVLAAIDNQVETSIAQSVSIEATEKEQLVLARRGQGRFRQKVLCIESSCRVTGVADPRFLIASHIQPWRCSSNAERLDGENGLMLSPAIDFLFDRGFIAFADDGILLISPVVNDGIVEKLGLAIGVPIKCGLFSAKQKQYLSFHRANVFLQSGVDE
jgi:hypothetical protein